MKRVVLLIIGLFPLFLGYIQDHFLLTFKYYYTSLFLLSNLTVLVIWFVAGVISAKRLGSKKESLILLNAPALVMLLHNLFQEVILGYYLPNHVGKMGQMFYLSQLNIAFNLSLVFFQQLFFAYIIAFCLMFIVSFLGCTVGSYRVGGRALAR